MFVGVCIDSSLLPSHNAIDTFRSNKLLNLVLALTPSYLRVGGTKGDSITFDLHATKSHTTNVNGISHYNLPVSVWDELSAFVHKSGLKLIYGLNVQERKHGKWDPTNSVALINYSSHKGYHVAGFELGNEPNLFYRNGAQNMSEAQLGADFQELKRILQTTSYKHSLVLGPDTAGYRETFTENFFSHGGSLVDVITFHHYYMDGHTASVSDFMDTHKLDDFKNTVGKAVRAAGQENPPKVVWLGETSSAYGGGTVNVSDRYVAGVMWLDKLGISARYGLKGVMRQSLYGGHYGLLNNNLDPNPDYWLTVLYKRLVGNKVFDVQTTSHHIRIYAHCTKRNNQYNYKPGSLTVYAINLQPDPMYFAFPHLQGQHHLDVFWLTPEKGDPKAERVLLNGKILTYTNGKIPPMAPETVTSGSVKIPAKTFGYIVIPGANIAACKTPDHGTIVG